MYKKSALFVKMGGQRRMGEEKISSTTSVSIATNNFKTKEDHKSFQERFGMIMYGKDKPLLTSKQPTAKAKKQYAE